MRYFDSIASYLFVGLPFVLVAYLLTRRLRRFKLTMQQQKLQRATSDPAGVHLQELQASVRQKARRKRNALHSEHHDANRSSAVIAQETMSASATHIMPRQSRSLLASVYTQISPMLDRVKDRVKHRGREAMQDFDKLRHAASKSIRSHNSQLPLYEAVNESDSDAIELTSQPLYGLLYIQLLEAKLPRSAYHFVVLSFGTQVFKTCVQSHASSQPVFAQKVRLLVKEREWHWPIVLSVYNKSRRSCTLVGRATVPAHQLISQGVKTVCNMWQPLSMPTSNVIKNSRSANGLALALDASQPLARSHTQNSSQQITTEIPPDQQCDDEMDDDEVEETSSFLHSHHNEQQKSRLTESMSNSSIQRCSSANSSIIPVSQPNRSKTNGTVITPASSAINQPQSTPTCGSLHMEVLFVNRHEAIIGEQMWRDMVDLYDVHDTQSLSREQLHSLCQCIGNLPSFESILAELNYDADANSVPCSQVVDLLLKIERMGLEAQERQQTSIDIDTRSNSEQLTAARRHSRVCLTDAPFHALSEGVTAIYMSKCPVCLLELSASFGLVDIRDSLVHVQLCIENIHSIESEMSLKSSTVSSTDGPSEFACGGYVSEALAIKNWTNHILNDTTWRRTSLQSQNRLKAQTNSPQSHTRSVTHGENPRLHSYLSKRAHYIMVQDRLTGQLVEEKVPILLKLFFRLSYHTYIGRFANSKINLSILQKMTEMMGRSYSTPASRAKIKQFISYYSIDMSQFEGSVDSYHTFNDFFARSIKPECRPIAAPKDDSIIVSPADCRLTLFQNIDEATRIWIKGKTFSLSSLLLDQDLVQKWKDCSLVIARLAPQGQSQLHTVAYIYSRSSNTSHTVTLSLAPSVGLCHSCSSG